MRYAGIIYNDFAAAPGVSLSFFTQGCHHHCKGCHNPETWDINGGLEFTPQVYLSVLDGLVANDIKRNFCIMGGEPLNNVNKELTLSLVQLVKETYPEIKIYIWTGFHYESLQNYGDTTINTIFQLADFLIDGPYIEEKRDITLLMRGSTNQRIINLKTGDIIDALFPTVLQDKERN